ncbi:hypothetical protein COU87_04340 [Candidatus Roizmanbacteria bacterium CG10_big_fil_rev_8_21_14_0_10_39_12]|uniref:Glycosyl transferase family 1 domain-containing protein n=1 Tax=Candidatus Roizmanbacteria bacterium CG10_big_fil_rev_8_21_14_0_10_39_12 TaxID=1974852 RepID=A0A2M8KNL2_9BACT|nr:MAG: hypothetical protein COY15_04830 [Candidatus Roizmanbacteria bacterium CG_4_10_14_0_2_um_filter_39_12]PJE61490.1 MAG: hypothetical protein COU87_04340 [Candidatus Roizmanbacteria bacterium CG10_big_fil_rev_8_21_14_0_10_39_12]
MRIGLLLPSLLASKKQREGRIFAPLSPAILLADTLVEKGHEVYFYTSGDVQTKAHIIFGDKRLTDSDLKYFQFRDREASEKKFTTIEIIKRDFEYDLTLKAYTDASDGKLDIIHSYHDFGAHYFHELTKFPTVFTLHNPLPQDKSTVEYLRLSKFKNHSYVSISNSQRESILTLNFVDTIYHGLNLEPYTFNNNPENYIVYFGRMIEEKGLDIAIQVALDLKIKLYIATSITPANTSQDFYNTKIKPYIDGENIKIFDYMEKNELVNIIKNAKTFLFPLRWKEPFGLTVIESMACGTPVVAFSNGSMPELIVDGKTGFLVDNSEAINGLKKAIGNINQINRKECREHIEKNFSKERMTNKYIDAYHKTISRYGK